MIIMMSTFTNSDHVLTYFWISPSMAPKLTLNVAWCFREDRRGGWRCWRPAAGRLSWLWSFWSGGELDDRQLAATAWGSAFCSNAGSAGSCVRSFFRRHDNWGLRRTTRVPPGQRILKNKEQAFLLNLFWVTNEKCEDFLVPFHFPKDER